MKLHGQSPCLHAEVRDATQAWDLPCSLTESAEAYPPTHKTSEGYPPRIHLRPQAVVFCIGG